MYEQCFCASVSGWTEPVTVSKREPRSPGSNLPKARGKLVAEPGCRSFLSRTLRQPSVFWKNEWLSRTCCSLPHQELGVNNTRRETKNKSKCTKNAGGYCGASPLNDVNGALLATQETKSSRIMFFKRINLKADYVMVTYHACESI